MQCRHLTYITLFKLPKGVQVISGQGEKLFKIMLSLLVPQISLIFIA